MQLSDVEKLAELARLELASEEKEVILKDLQAILGYVDQISKAPMSEIKKEHSLRNVMREDENPHAAGIYTEKILAAAPETKDGFIKVQKIL